MKYCKTISLLKNPEELSGVVVNKERAGSTGICTKIKGTNLVFSEGIVGALSDEQKEKYCKHILEVERPEIVARHERFKHAVETCKEKTKHLEGAERVKAYIECMEKEASEEG